MKFSSVTRLSSVPVPPQPFKNSQSCKSILQKLLYCSSVEKYNSRFINALSIFWVPSFSTSSILHSLPHPQIMEPVKIYFSFSAISTTLISEIIAIRSACSFCLRISASFCASSCSLFHCSSSARCFSCSASSAASAFLSNTAISKSCSLVGSTCSKSQVEIFS